MHVIPALNHLLLLVSILSSLVVNVISADSNSTPAPITISESLDKKITKLDKLFKWGRIFTKNENSTTASRRRKSSVAQPSEKFLQTALKQAKALVDHSGPASRYFNKLSGGIQTLYRRILNHNSSRCALERFLNGTLTLKNSSNFLTHRQRSNLQDDISKFNNNTTTNGTNIHISLKDGVGISVILVTIILIILSSVGIVIPVVVFAMVAVIFFITFLSGNGSSDGGGSGSSGGMQIHSISSTTNGNGSITTTTTFG